MSTDATEPTSKASTETAPIAKDKGKEVVARDESFREENEEMEDEEDEEVEEQVDSDEEEDEDLSEIDPSVITTRRTRGKKVDYTSAEALAKAGLKPETGDDDEEGDFVMKD